MKISPSWFVLTISIIFSCNTHKQQDVPVQKTVEVIKSGDRFSLMRNGAPYIIKGACVLDTRYFRQLKENGGNSVRTYDTENAMAILDSAGKYGLTVTLGLKLPYANRGFNYRNDKAVELEVEKAGKEVMKYKDHPALLMWGIGNELSLYLKASSIPEHIAVLQTIERIAKMIHKVDPNHPTTTTLPFSRTNTISAVDMFCSNVDVISMNSFEQLQELPSRARKYSKPYIMSEYGAKGYWIAMSTNWYTEIEQTSAEKCAYILEQYRAMKSDSSKFLGSYAFIWGHKLEYTTSWFSLFTESGEATQVIDALHYTWTGKWPPERAPAIYSIKINELISEQNIIIPPGEKFVAGITTDAGHINSVYVTGRLHKDDLEISDMYAQANYRQEKNPDLIPGDAPLEISGYHAVNENGLLRSRINIQFQAPPEPGPYRLFLNLHNKKNRVATANICFYVHD